MRLHFVNLHPKAFFLNRYFHFEHRRFDQKEATSKNLLEEYKNKRDFNKTKEPQPIYDNNKANEYRFVVQEHHASVLHYDFRLECNGVMKRSIPKGPSLNPREKRLAIMVEDHPLLYMNFEGTIPDGEYGAGEVRIWDSGTFKSLVDTDVNEHIEKGKLSFVLYGKTLKGEFRMIRLQFLENQRTTQWLLMKTKDQFADEHFKLKRILDYGSRKELQQLKETHNNVQDESI